MQTTQNLKSIGNLIGGEDGKHVLQYLGQQPAHTHPTFKDIQESRIVNQNKPKWLFMKEGNRPLIKVKCMFTHNDDGQLKYPDGRGIWVSMDKAPAFLPYSYVGGKGITNHELMMRQAHKYLENKANFYSTGNMYLMNHAEKKEYLIYTFIRDIGITLDAIPEIILLNGKNVFNIPKKEWGTELIKLGAEEYNMKEYL